MPLASRREGLFILQIHQLVAPKIDFRSCLSAEFNLEYGHPEMAYRSWQAHDFYD